MIRLKHTKYLAYPLLAIAVWYLPTSFFYWDMNAGNWDEEARMIVGIESMITIIIAIALAHYHINKLK